MNRFAKTLFATTAALAFVNTANATETREPEASYTIERVTFVSGGETIVGNLYVPTGTTAASPAEAVVVTGAWTTIKEQMPATYAEALAENGQIALAFDFRTWGESGGQTRSLENPSLKIKDIQAAGRFLSTRMDVTEVNGLGICASAGYMATAAEQSDVFQSIALVAPWLHNAEIVDEVYGGAETVQSLIATGRAAAAREAETGTPQLIPAAGDANSGALMAFDGGYYNDPQLGRVEAWENTFNVASWEGWLTFDAIRSADGIEAPTMIIHSEAAAIPHGAKAFYADLTVEKKELWLDSVTQFEFYYREDAVLSATDAATTFFEQN